MCVRVRARKSYYIVASAVNFLYGYRLVRAYNVGNKHLHFLMRSVISQQLYSGVSRTPKRDNPLRFIRISPLYHFELGNIYARYNLHLQLNQIE